MIKIEGLKKTYNKHTKYATEVLHGMSLELPDRGFVCILGASGCGKTSLLNAIGGLDEFDEGKITTERTVITKSPSREMERERNASFGYIFQNYYLLKEHSAAYNVYIGMHSLDLPYAEKLKRVKEALERVDMQRYSKRLVGELSGGQQQRVAIARAIARRPRVIFADEPTGNLDQINTLNICKILKELSRESLIVMVTHEEDIARLFADRIITVKDGRVEADSSDFERRAIDGGAKDTVYAMDYEEQKLEGDSLDIRILCEKDAAPAKLTVVVEGNRIIVKSLDNRVIIASDNTNPPFIEEGKRPILNGELLAEEGEKVISDAPAAEAPKSGKGRRGIGLGFKLLFAEARSMTVGSKLKKFGIGLFIVILSLMMAISTADIISISSVKPEDFVRSSKNTLEITMSRGEKFSSPYDPLSPYIAAYREHLDESGIDFDYLPKTVGTLVYTDNSFPQIGKLKMDLSGHSIVNISRLDPSDIVKGRMPERSDEIVIDKAVLEATLGEEGILQNTIPNAEYFLGKYIKSERKSYAMRIVGICDEKDASVYMSTEAILSVGVYGSEVITLSEYKRLTGDGRADGLKAGQCYVLTANTGGFFSAGSNVSSLVGSNYHLVGVDTLSGTRADIKAKLLIADEDLIPLYNSMIAAATTVDLWCADKDALAVFLEGALPEELDGMLTVRAYDDYGTSLSRYKEQASAKADARTIVTAAITLSAILMLYFMQRSRIRERMDLVAVYRLLGIKKSSLVLVFAIENAIQTVKYALPTVLGVFALSKLISSIELFEALKLEYPLWATALTLLGISLVRIAVAIIPLLKLLSEPPAKLAARYDF